MGDTATGRGGRLLAAATRGAGAGLVGVAAMTMLEKAEQAVTGRPNSYVPGRTMRALMGSRPPERARPLGANHAMHWTTGAVLGCLRGVWAATDMRGPRANAVHTVVRLATDQTLENVAGTGAPPHTWPRDEQLVDVVHKGVYSFVTGLVADRLVRPRLRSRRGAVSH